MNVTYDADFLRKFKKVDVRIQKSFKEKISLFSKNPHDPQLENHELKKEYQGYKSINITADWRAIYIETEIGNVKTAYFVFLGMHQELYK